MRIIFFSSVMQISILKFVFLSHPYDLKGNGWFQGEPQSLVSSLEKAKEQIENLAETAHTKFRDYLDDHTQLKELYQTANQAVNTKDSTAQASLKALYSYLHQLQPQPKVEAVFFK